MSIITIIKNSRAEWKRKAIERGVIVRDLRKALLREYSKRRVLEQRLSLLEEEFKLLEMAKEESRPIVLAPSAAVTRATCVLLAVVAIIPFRSVPRVLTVVQYRGWIPHFTSVINWTLRVGLWLLEEVKPVEAPWIAIVDMSIDVAVKKALVVLRVPMDALAKRGSAITLEDCECIGVQVASSWKGTAVCAALTGIFEKSGNPTVILKDGGTDLGLGVRLWRSAKKQNKKSYVIDDIGHVAANGLKADFGWTQGFKNFLASIFAGASKLRQSELAFLTPPKVRTKGRFQGITKLAEWAERIIPLLGPPGRFHQDSFTDRLRKLLGGLGKHRLFLIKFTHTCSTVRAILEIAKHRGINQKTYAEIKAELSKLPIRSRSRKRLSAWLDRHIDVQCKLSMGQNPLMVSSDVIESLMGKLKVVLMRNPKAEFNRIILSLPTLCNRLSSSTVEQALAAINHSDLQAWESENVRQTQHQKRRAFNAGNFHPDPVPKTGIAA